MRTTISLPDDLLQVLREDATRRNVTLSELIEEAVRRSLARPQRAKRTTFAMPTDRAGRLRPGVDLNDSAALLAVMDEA